jgi:CRISPR-associated protein Cas8b/Csh1 subtype I-B
MLSPEEFREEYPEAELADELPDSPVGSLRDIQYLYGTLYTLGTTGGGTYAPYLTPDAAGDLLDTADSLIVVRVDLSGDEPRLATDDPGPVWVTRYSEDRVEKVAHCKYPAARGIDHSVTHQAGRNSGPEKLARYATERLTKWAIDEVVRETADEHEDGWMIEALAGLGEDEDVIAAIEEGVKRELGGESATALLTVQVKTDADGTYRWPGDLDVFLEAMRRRKLSKLVTKNKADDSSGEATDLVTGESARTVGTSEDPLNYFLGKQREKFPGLDIEEAWRTHPISEDAAVTVMNAETFVEACTYRTFGAKVYYLPYPFGRVSPADAHDLYQLLHTAAEDEGSTPIEDAYRERDVLFGETELRFYVSAVIPHQMSRYDVFGETLNGRLFYPVALAREHNAVVGTDAFVPGDEWTAPLPTHDNWELLAGSDDQLHSVATGWYFAQTFAERDDDAATADDPRIDALVAVLGGGSISVESLLGEYVDRIGAEETADEPEGFPSFLVASQFAQLCALAADDLDLLSTTDAGKRPITREPTYDTHDTKTMEEILADGGNPGATTLESFIEETPALAPTDGADLTIADQRRGAFLLGALVGAVGNYQGYDLDRSTTLVDQFPVKSITRNRIKKVTQEAIGKTLTYTRSEGRTVTKFDHIVERLRETIVNPDPDEWSLDTDDLRFYYALGVTYGLNDRAKSSTDTADTEEDS